MLTEILVSILLFLLSFRSGMEYQRYKSQKAELETLERKVKALKPKVEVEASAEMPILDIKPEAESK